MRYADVFVPRMPNELERDLRASGPDNATILARFSVTDYAYNVVIRLRQRSAHVSKSMLVRQNGLGF